MTADGFKLQLGTNHLGHCALTAGLLPLLKDSRVVSLSSVAVIQGALDFDALNAQKSDRPMPVYAQSKLACLMFALELQRRSGAKGWRLTSITTHPRVARTDLRHNARGKRSGIGLARSFLWFLFLPAAKCAPADAFCGNGTRGSARRILWAEPLARNAQPSHPRQTAPSSNRHSRFRASMAAKGMMTGLVFGAP